MLDYINLYFNKLNVFYILYKRNKFKKQVYYFDQMVDLWIKKKKVYKHHNICQGFFDDTTCLNWSDCSKLVAVGSKDSNVNICTVETMRNVFMYSLKGAGTSPVGVFFEETSLDCWLGKDLEIYILDLDLVC